MPHLTVIPSEVIDAVARGTGCLGLAVYVYLRRRADANGTCYPSYNTMADDLQLSRSTAIRYTKALIEAGFISRYRSANGYVWVVSQVDVPVSQGHHHGVAGTPPSVTENTESLPLTPGGVTENTESLPVTPKVIRTKRDIYLSGFEQFWKAYPKHVGKAEAARAWVDMKLEPRADEIVAAIARHRAAGRFSDDPRYILHPVRWLKYRRFEDDVADADASVNKRDGRYLAG